MTNRLRSTTVDSVTSADGIRIHFKKTGSGPAIVLIDGAFCNSEAGPMVKLAPLLAENFTVYSYDRRGRGKSMDAGIFKPIKEISDLKALVAHINEPVSLFGMSSGAVLALRAMEAGIAVEKLALYEPPFFTGSHKRPPADHAERMQELITKGNESGAVKYFMTKIMKVPFFVPLFLQFTRRWKWMTAQARSLVFDCLVMQDFEVPKDLLQKISIPTIVIGGEKSQVVLRDAVNATAENIKGSQVLFLKDQSHDISPVILAPALTQFFTRA